MLRLVVSTPLQVFLVNPYNQKCEILRTGDGYYYGITFHSGTVVLTHSGGYLQYFKNKGPTRETRNCLIQPHQLEWVGNRIIVSNTGKNCLSVFDSFGNFIMDKYLNEIRIDDKDTGRGGNHFNSIHRQGNNLFVVAHNYERPSEVWVLSYPELEVIGKDICNASWAHNYWECEWGRIICNSKDGSLYEIDTGETIWHSGEKDALTRGMAATDEYIFIGYSSQNERRMRYWKTGGIWVIDRKSLTTIDKLLFQGSGDVHEIRIVGSTDACHNNQIFAIDDLGVIQNSSALINLSYYLRKSYPKLQKDIFPISQMVRFTQMIARWKRSLRQKRF